MLSQSDKYNYSMKERKKGFHEKKLIPHREDHLTSWRMRIVALIPNKSNSIYICVMLIRFEDEEEEE